MHEGKQPLPPDPHDLARFVSAQNDCYDQALMELQRGRKESHWMWFIFPQLAGLGHSHTARFYGIKSVAEAKAYLAHPLLASRLLSCCHALLALEGTTADSIFDSPDDLKLHSSMTLFAQVAEGQREFAQVLSQYFAGKVDQQTIALIRQQP
jgi:uncharacterized protein (DUF1810 family)